MSIRLRLTVWYVGVLLLGFVVLGTALYFQTRATAGAAFDATLRERAVDLSYFVSRDSPVTLGSSAPDEASGQLGGTALWIRVLDSHGKQVASQGPPLAGVPDQILDNSGQGFHAAPGLRSYVLTLMRHGRPVGAIQVISPTTLVAGTANQFIQSLILVGAFTILVAAVSGLLLANVALRPVDRITRVAQEIGEGDLSRRVGSSPHRGWFGRVSRADEIGRLAQTFDAMLARLDESNQRRRHLTADIAHQLSNPLASIRSGIEGSLRRERTTSEYRRSLERLLDESIHMQHVVDDLLLISRVDAGNLPMEREIVELDEVCRDVVEGRQDLAAERDIRLMVAVPSGPVLVLGDALRLEQVVRNLLDNALRFTPPGGTVSVTLDVPGYDGATRAAVHVRDSGPGISPQDRERIFERAYQGHMLAFHRSQSRGSGLGLAIARAIVVGHQGRVMAVDPDDVSLAGAHLLVELPLVPSPRTVGQLESSGVAES